MSLRNRLLALSLLTLLLPWSGWKLLQELEQFLRDAQETTLLSSARTLAGSLPFDTQSTLLYTPQPYLVLRRLESAPLLDGFIDEWPDPQHGLELISSDGQQRARVLAADSGAGLALVFEVARILPAAVAQASGRHDRIELGLRSPRGLQSFTIDPEAPGPLQLQVAGGSGQVEGHWRDTPDGYRLELALPVPAHDTDVRFRLGDDAGGYLWVADGAGSGAVPASQLPPTHWFTLVSPSAALSQQLATAIPAASRAWLVDRAGWVLADSGVPEAAPGAQTTWVQRWLYRLVAASRTRIRSPPEEPQLRLHDAPVLAALGAVEATAWSQDPDTAVVRNTVVVPVLLDGQARGALVLQSSTEGLLLVTNRALGRLLLTTLVITFGLAGGLWVFATRLSQRVRRLSGAVSEAMQDGVVTGVLPLLDDRDELGQLARNNDTLLRALADYSQYLQTLAGKLSHELKTPLAITRSSLENLASRPLDEDARRFLQRAMQGMERQAQIVRAMSEASRLEAAIRSAEWEHTDLASLLRHCAEGYRAVHPTRRIDAALPPGPMPMRCAPDLLAQALDKLVDNAISLSGEQDRVALTLRSEGESYCLAVSNTGSRLPQELQDRLFDSLVSLRTRRDEVAHLGLGLYIVRLVATAHGGTARARNLGAADGVVFELHLPIDRRLGAPGSP